MDSSDSRLSIISRLSPSPFEVDDKVDSALGAEITEVFCHLFRMGIVLPGVR